MKGPRNLSHVTSVEEIQEAAAKEGREIALPLVQRSTRAELQAIADEPDDETWWMCAWDMADAQKVIEAELYLAYAKAYVKAARDVVADALR